eukprot:4415512-Alexandrium_andersonii.AAC.1
MGPTSYLWPEGPAAVQLESPSTLRLKARWALSGGVGAPGVAHLPERDFFVQTTGEAAVLVGQLGEVSLSRAWEQLESGPWGFDAGRWRHCTSLAPAPRFATQGVLDSVDAETRTRTFRRVGLLGQQPQPRGVCGPPELLSQEVAWSLSLPSL